MKSQFAEPEYPKAHILKVKALDTLIVIIGLVLAASPFVEHAYPGAFDTTVHVGLGTLITVCALFRVLVAFGSLWLEVVLFAFGLVALLLPRFEHMRWHDRYNTAHQVAGGLIMVLALLSAAVTLPVLKKMRSA